MADLKGRIAVVSGANRGVGRGIALGLAEAGATVYVTGRSSSGDEPPAPLTVEDTARAVDALGGCGIPVELDHSDDQAVAGLFRRIEAEAGRLDLLVNNAYQMPDPPVWEGGFWEHPLSVWDDQCGVGLRGCYVAAALGARLMVAQGSGLIVNLSSRGGTDYAFSVSYGVGKAGVERMASDMAVELDGRGVAVLALVPGAVKTEFVEQTLQTGAAALDPRVLQTPRYVGRCVAALAMDPDVMEKSGGRHTVADLAREYRFSELDDAKDRS